MRPIKYRIWNKTDKKYIYSDEFNQDDSTLFVLKSFFEFVYDSYIISEKEFEDPEQFTGLHDKNGLEIYEGDILTDYCSVGEIIWQKDHCKFSWKSSKCYMPMYDDKSLTIIGNIHQNHELLGYK